MQSRNIQFVSCCITVTHAVLLEVLEKVNLKIVCISAEFVVSSDRSVVLHLVSFEFICSL